MNKKFIIGLIVILLALAVFSVAQPTGLKCTSQKACDALGVETGKNFTCNTTKGLCELVIPKVVNVPKNVTTKKVDPVDTLGKDVTSVKSKLAAVETSTASLKTELGLIKNNLRSVEKQVISLQQQLNSDGQDTDTKLKSVSTGLAGLQKTLGETEETVEDLEGSVGTTKGLVWLLVLVVLAGGGIGFWLLRKGGSSSGGRRKLDPDTAGYITAMTQRGAKFPSVKAGLMQSGWSATDAEWAYKKTMKANYKKYKASKKGNVAPPTPEEAAAQGQMMHPKHVQHHINKAQKRMMGAVGAVVLVAVIIGFVVFGGSTEGQAINLGQSVKEDTNELVYEVTCTPPHIESDEGCCLDENANGVCDTAEADLAAQKGNVEDPNVCTNHDQCTAGKKCINSKCGELKDLTTDNPACSCSYNFVAFKTSDGEELHKKPLRGSYTYAGALAWTLLESPTYCPGQAVIPVEIETVDKGKVLSRKIITLKKFQESKALTHEVIKDVQFKLSVENIFENSC